MNGIDPEGQLVAIEFCRLQGPGQPGKQACDGRTVLQQFQISNGGLQGHEV
jgi:hypothetical protein